jgi:RNA polymerase sigma factor (sigma-70 family)
MMLIRLDRPSSSKVSWDIPAGTWNNPASDPYSLYGRAMALRELTPDDPAGDGRIGKLYAVQGGVVEGLEVPVTGEELLEDFYDGDDAALDRLMTRYDWLRHWVISRLPYDGGARPQRAEDIVQRAWVKVIESKGGARWRREKGSVRPWLLQIVSHCMVDEFRERRNVPGGGVAMADAADPAQQELLAWCELRSAVVESLGALEALELQVVVLKYWAGSRQNQIARKLGVSPATVSRCLASARGKLRESLSGAGWEDD